MENNYCVYVHTNKINGKKYVGQTCKRPQVRFGKNGAGYIGSRIFYNAILKYGWDNFSHEILFTNLTSEQANLIEQAVISAYNTTDRRFGYNLQSGGRNHKLADETKQILSKIKTGKYTGSQNPFYGQKHTEETRKIMSQKHYDCNGEKNPNYGKKHTAESKEKMRTSRQGKHILQYDLNGNFIKEWEYMSLARQEYNLDKRSLQKACNGKLKTTGGYIWRYKE
jgi:group I intron endonuclease